MATNNTNGVGVRDLAEKLDTTPVRLRAFLRSTGVGVGSGARYTWPSMTDPGVKKIITAWNAAHAEAAPDASADKS